MTLELTRFSDAQMEAQYNLRLLRPDYDTVVVPGWMQRSADARKHLDCVLEIPYGPSPRTKLDVFAASGEGNPVLLYFHGGYWQRGSKEDYSFLAEPFVAAGVTVVMAGYDLCPDVTMTELVAQTRAAATYVWRNAAQWGGDRDRITVMGHSAGGHITGMLIATDWTSIDADLPKAIFRAAIPVSPLNDLEPLRPTTLNRALRITDAEVVDLSPQGLAPIDDAPQLVVVGARETKEFHRQADNYFAAHKTAARAMQRLSVPGCDHFDLMDELANPQSDFFKRTLSLVTSTEGTSSMPTFTADNLAALLAAFNAHDLDGIMDHFAPDAVMIAPAGKNGNGTRLEGRDAIRDAFEKRFTAQPDVQWNDAESFMEGDRAFTSWRVQAPGAGIDISGCDVWTFRDGKVVTKDTFYKQLA